MTARLLHPTLTDPRTGAPLCAIGIGRRGPIWPVMGAAEDNGGTGEAGDGSAGGAQGDAGAGGAQDATGAAGGNGQGGGTAGSAQDAADDVSKLPEWAQKVIKESRADAAKARTGAKTAAEQAQKELTDKLAVALGLKPDAATDPAELTKQVSAAQAAAKDAAVQLAVYRTAGKHQADPDALLDSSSFLRTLADIDHTAGDFGAKVDAAIKTAVASNAKLKAVQAAAVSGAPHAGGPGGEQRPVSLGQAIANHYKA